MAAQYSNTQLLDELEALSQSLYNSHTSTSTARRTASLALPRTSVPPISSADDDDLKYDDKQLNPKPRSRRMSLSPWRSRAKLDSTEEHEQKERIAKKDHFKKLDDEKVAGTSEKKGLWSWKPIRALSHIGMQKLSCLFSVEVVTVQGLPASMGGLRLSVCVRKKETKDGAVQTMPSRAWFAESAESKSTRSDRNRNRQARSDFDPICIGDGESPSDSPELGRFSPKRVTVTPTRRESAESDDPSADSVKKEERSAVEVPWS